MDGSVYGNLKFFRSDVLLGSSEFWRILQSDEVISYEVMRRGGAFVKGKRSGLYLLLDKPRNRGSVLGDNPQQVQSWLEFGNVHFKGG